MNYGNPSQINLTLKVLEPKRTPKEIEIKFKKKKKNLWAKSKISRILGYKTTPGKNVLSEDKLVTYV